MIFINITYFYGPILLLFFYENLQSYLTISSFISKVKLIRIKIIINFFENFLLLKSLLKYYIININF